MSANPQQDNNSEEVDLGQLFQMIGNAFRSFFNLIGRILNGIFLAFIWFVLFIKKNIIILGAAVVIGLVLGIIQDKASAPVYKSETIIRQNYDTGETLNDLINYINELVISGDTINLSDNLKINSSEAGKILEFSLEALVTKNQQLQSFDNYKRDLDSVTASTLEFENYISSVKDYNYRDQKVIVRSSDQIMYSAVVGVIIDRVSSSNYFRNEQQKDLAELERRESAIREALMESDSLQKVYETVLAKSVEQQTGSQTSVTIDNIQDKGITKEYELYNKNLELRRELVEIARTRENKEFVIEVLSEPNKVGVKEKRILILEHEVSRSIFYALILGVGVLLFLLSRNFLKFIENYSTNQG